MRDGGREGGWSGRGQAEEGKLGPLPTPHPQVLAVSGIQYSSQPAGTGHHAMPHHTTPEHW